MPDSVMRTLPPTPSERESSPPWVVVAAVSRVGVGLFAGMYWSLFVGDPMLLGILRHQCRRIPAVWHAASSSVKDMARPQQTGSTACRAHRGDVRGRSAARPAVAVADGCREQAGLSRGAVLYYYEDLDALLVEAHAAGVERFCDQRDATVAGLDDPRDRLGAAIDAGPAERARRRAHEPALRVRRARRQLRAARRARAEALPAPGRDLHAASSPPGARPGSSHRGTARRASSR